MCRVQPLYPRPSSRRRPAPPLTAVAVPVRPARSRTLTPPPASRINRRRTSPSTGPPPTALVRPQSSRTSAARARRPRRRQSGHDQRPPTGRIGIELDAPPRRALYSVFLHESGSAPGGVRPRDLVAAAVTHPLKDGGVTDALAAGGRASEVRRHREARGQSVGGIRTGERSRATGRLRGWPPDVSAVAWTPCAGSARPLRHLSSNRSASSRPRSRWPTGVAPDSWLTAVPSRRADCRRRPLSRTPPPRSS